MMATPGSEESSSIFWVGGLRVLCGKMHIYAQSIEGVGFFHWSWWKNGMRSMEGLEPFCYTLQH